MPFSFILSRTATSSSQVSGALPPAASSAALLIHTQLVEWTFTGAEIQLPPCLPKACRAPGTTSSQPSLPATSLRLPSAPSLAQSRMSKPSICTAVGAFPAVTRARSAVMASVPPPPATGMSCQVTPLDSRSSLSTFRAAASPPEVHQCSTSTSSATAVVPAVPSAPAEASRAVVRNLRFIGVSSFVEMSRVGMFRSDPVIGSTSSGRPRARGMDAASGV